MYVVKAIALIPLLPVAIAVPGAAQSTPPQFVSKACGFRARIPAGWKIKPSLKKCRFAVIPPNRADGNIELVVRDGDMEQGSNDLGFANDGGKWTLQGEDSVEAVHIESLTWTGLQGSVATRIYQKGFYSGLGDQTRALLFDRKNRIAEVTCYVGEGPVAEFVKGFEFLDKPQP
jgi:hypothetical protein